MKMWGITNTGLVRSENQDAYAAFEAGGCTAAVVCDGMGGTHGGRVASAIAVACFQREIQNDLRADMTADQLCHVMLAAIAAANDAIADPKLSAQIDDIESTCRVILQRLEEQPNMLSSLRTFLRYYLPATLKLLNARAQLESEVNAGSNQNIASRISDAVSAVQSAFHKQLDALNEFRFINLESEMDVLTDMLKSDGLTADSDAPDLSTTKAAPQEDDPFASLFAKGDQK